MQWPGVGASIAPATPGRSLPNSVIYDDPAALLERYEELAEAYAGAGVLAFTVWVDPSDEPDLVPELERRGHVRDAEPLLQAAVLDELALTELAGEPLDLDPDPTFAKLGRLNDAAWRMQPGGLSDCFSTLDDAPAAALVRIALLDGEPACGLGVFPSGEDAYVSFVATAPKASRRGLATRLLASTLIEARERGAVTTTLEATAAGAPVYERMGYRSLWRLGMYERREPG
jgi:GNAT superfamily N-acetyltransferase